MTRTPLLFAALVPFMATAAGEGDKSVKVDQEKLRGAVPATAVLGEEVQGSDGSEIGEVQDIVLTRDGRIEHVLVDRNDSAQDPENDERAGDENIGSQDGGGAERAWADKDIAQVDAEKIRFDAADDTLTVDTSGQDDVVSPAPRGPERAGQGRTLTASDVLGMEVNLSDNDSFGRIEDVMIGAEGKEVVALVVDNWDGLDKERRAFAVDAASFNEESGEVDYELSSEEVKELPEFNLDKHRNDSWFGDNPL